MVRQQIPSMDTVIGKVDSEYNLSVGLKSIINHSAFASTYVKPPTEVHWEFLSQKGHLYKDDFTGNYTEYNVNRRKEPIVEKHEKIAEAYKCCEVI